MVAEAYLILPTLRCSNRTKSQEVSQDLLLCFRSDHRYRVSVGLNFNTCGQVEFSLETINMTSDCNVFFEKKMRSFHIKSRNINKNLQYFHCFKCDSYKYSSEIFIANNGFDAFDICSHNRELDLLLMDFNMPVPIPVLMWLYPMKPSIYILS